MPTIKTASHRDPVTGVTTFEEYPDWSEEIARGINFLDQVQPGWVKHVNPAILDLQSTETCVCGQVFSDYYDGGVVALTEWLNRNEVTVDSNDTEQVTAVASDYAFNLPTLNVRDVEFSRSVSAEDVERYSSTAAKLRSWAEGYVKQVNPEFVDSDSFQLEDEVYNVLFSAMTEQWIIALRNHKDAPAPASV